MPGSPADYSSRSQLNEAFEEILKTQDALNSKSYSATWRDRFVKDSFDYPFAAVHELCEMSASEGSWKWWSKTKHLSQDDLRNCKMELVDAIHFIASVAIVVSDNIPNGAHVLAAGAFVAYEQQPVLHELEEDGLTKAQYVRHTTKRLMRTLLQDKFVMADLVSIGHDFNVLCMYAADMSIRDLQSLYLAKATLNAFRMENGYQYKNYIKKWKLEENKAEREDNAWLLDWMFEQPRLPKTQEVRAWLEETYKRVTA